MTAAGRRGSYQLLAVVAAASALLSVGSARAQAPFAPPDAPPRPNPDRRPSRFRFEIQPPADGLQVDRHATIAWKSKVRPDALDVQFGTLTWFYATDPQGADRKRMVSNFHLRFDDRFGDHWIPVNALRTDWAIEPDPARVLRNVLRGRTNGDPLVSVEQWEDPFVVSVKLRPRPGASDFGVGVRASRNRGSLYALRGTAELFNPEVPQPLKEAALPAVDQEKWYWYEIGVTTQKQDVVVRGRIWDGEHRQALIPTLCYREVAGMGNCPDGKRIALLGGADFSEIYVDPWQARWPGGQAKPSFEWDTSTVPDGDYYVIAVWDLEHRGSVQQVSDFKISVRH